MAQTSTAVENVSSETVEVVVDPVSKEATKKSRWKVLIFISLVFLYIFSNNIISTPLTDLLMNRVCLKNFKYSAEVCNNIKNFTDIEDRVQIQSTQISLYSSMIKIFPSACLSVFVGPWSDKYGRKPFMYLSVIGSMLYDIGVILYGVYGNTPVYVLYLASIPNGLTGDAVTFLGCMYSLASDSSDYRTRTRSFALLQVAIAVGASLGGLASGYLYKVGYVPVFGLGLSTHFATLVFLYFAIKDQCVRKQASVKTKIVDLISCDNFKENIRIFTTKRENKKTVQLVLVTISSSIIYLNYTSIYDVMFPFCKKMYHWDVTKYTSVLSVYAVSSIVVMTVTIPVLLRVLKVPDVWLGATGSFFFMAEHVVKAFAYYPWIYYISLAVSVMSGLAPFAVRAQISKTVQDGELGCVFAAVSSLENIAPIVGGPLFTGVYNSSINFFPGLVFLVAAATLLFPLIVFLWLTRIPNNIQKRMGPDEKEVQGQADREETANSSAS